MLDILKQFKDGKTKNSLSTSAGYADKHKNITLLNKYNELQNQEVTLNQRKKVGDARHNTPASKEWVNSTYSYNKNYIKTLPAADNVISKLVKGYLNMNPLINNKKTKGVIIRFKRLSLNQILISKAEVKHTNNKVIVTVYLYNRNKKFFLYKLKNLSQSAMTENLSLKKPNKANGKASIYNKKNLSLNKVGVNDLLKKLKFISLRAVKLINKAKIQKNLLFHTLDWDNNNFINYKNKYYKKFLKNAYEIELLYTYYIKMLSHNNNKFKNWFLLGLKKAISKLYNKKVEFNFVSLKYLHLNSDIFTQAIVTRIRNRDNGLLAVLYRALRLAKIPAKDQKLIYETKNNKKISALYKQNNSFLQGMFLTPSTNNPGFASFAPFASSGVYKKNDVLHVLLNNLFGQDFENNKNTAFIKKTKKLNHKQVNILDTIKHKAVFGIRLEAAGRLSKRLTASRSVFKLRYKGGLKNKDFSTNDMSTVMLRGNINSNLQYTLINNKTRNGSFGLKGWIRGY